MVVRRREVSSSLPSPEQPLGWGLRLVLVSGGHGVRGSPSYPPSLELWMLGSSLFLAPPWCRSDGRAPKSANEERDHWDDSGSIICLEYFKN